MLKELMLWYNRIETGITWGSFKKRSEVGAEKILVWISDLLFILNDPVTLTKYKGIRILIVDSDASGFSAYNIEMIVIPMALFWGLHLKK